MALPLIFFVVLLWLGREELGLKGSGLCLLICAALLLGCVFLNISAYVFIALLALFDVVLILVIFGGNIQIR